MALNPTSNFEPASGTDTTGISTTELALYDVTTFQQIGDPITLSGSIPFGWDITTDRTRYVSGTYNSPVGAGAVWDLDPGRWAARACRIARRNLTRAEWAQYLPGHSYERTCPAFPGGT